MTSIGRRPWPSAAIAVVVVVAALLAPGAAVAGPTGPLPQVDADAAPQVLPVGRTGPDGGPYPGYPPNDSLYHDYGEILDELEAVAAAHPSIVQLSEIGTSYAGRPIQLVKISDNVDEDEGEPEVLFDAMHHAREHITPEMALAVIGWLTDGYGSNSRITEIVESRVIWIIPVVNPDGFIWDLGREDGTYRGWRKNRQPNGDGNPVGTDLNRNYSFGWGGVGSSGSFSSEVYRGAEPFSAPEARRIRDFVLSRFDRRRAAHPNTHHVPRQW